MGSEKTKKKGSLVIDHSDPTPYATSYTFNVHYKTLMTTICVIISIKTLSEISSNRNPPCHA
jgi:hypothetical protein